MPTIAVGVDIGQKRDPTAIAVLEVQEHADASGRVRDHYIARYLERLPLGTPYPAVARRIAAIGANMRKRVAPEEIAGRGRAHRRRRHGCR